MDESSGDIDRNGIPNSIQRDPVVVPEPFDLFGDPPDVGLPGINSPIEASGSDEPTPELEMEQDVTTNRARTADKAADAMDDYIRG